jgi:mechanosensitive ion channel-like protein
MWDQLNVALQQSASRVIAGVANFLPGVLALILVLVVSVPVAWIVSYLVRRSLTSLHFDDRLSQWGFSSISEWSPNRSPTRLSGRVVFWTIVLLGLLVGLTAVDASLTQGLATRSLAYLPNVFVAIIVLMVGTVVARFLARGVLIGAVNMQMEHAQLISVGVKWLILVLAAAMALEHLGIGGTIVQLAFAILFGGIVLALALAVGLGSKDVVRRSWERREQETRETEQPFHHL